MAKWYPVQQIGVLDDTKIPADRADGRQVGAHLKTIICTRKAGEAWASADTVNLCKLKPGEHLRRVWITASASLGSATLSLGPAGAATKYLNAKTNTTVDTPTCIGPLASALDDGPLAAEELLILTIGGATIADTTNLTIELEIASVN